jgi:hypothetical protein
MKLHQMRISLLKKQITVIVDCFTLFGTNQIST